MRTGAEDQVPPIPTRHDIPSLAISQGGIQRWRPSVKPLGPGAIYTTIKRLLGDGLIEESDERPDPELDDQRRRYYRLTALGRSVAASEVRRLDALVSSARPWALSEIGG